MPNILLPQKHIEMHMHTNEFAVGKTYPTGFLKQKKRMHKHCCFNFINKTFCVSLLITDSLHQFVVTLMLGTTLLLK